MSQYHSLCVRPYVHACLYVNVCLSVHLPIYPFVIFCDCNCNFIFCVCVFCVAVFVYASANRSRNGQMDEKAERHRRTDMRTQTDGRSDFDVDPRVKKWPE